MSWQEACSFGVLVTRKTCRSDCRPTPREMARWPQALRHCLHAQRAMHARGRRQPGDWGGAVAPVGLGCLGGAESIRKHVDPT